MITDSSTRVCGVRSYMEYVNYDKAAILLATYMEARKSCTAGEV